MEIDHRALAEVGLRLEDAVKGLPGDPADDAELYERYEMVAIQILDSEFADFPEGILEAYLAGYLAGIRFVHANSNNI